MPIAILEVLPGILNCAASSGDNNKIIALLFRHSFLAILKDRITIDNTNERRPALSLVPNGLAIIVVSYYKYQISLGVRRSRY